MSKVTKKSLEDVEAGDWVYEISDYGHRVVEKQVLRTTKTQIHLSRYGKFRRCGSPVGGFTYGSASISVASHYAQAASRTAVRDAERNLGHDMARSSAPKTETVQRLRALADAMEAYLNEYGEDE